MSIKSEVPLKVEVKQSRYLLIFIILTHSLAIISILVLSVDFGLILCLVILAIYSLYFQLHRYQQGCYLFTLTHSVQFSWQLQNNMAVQILGSSVINAWLIILQVQVDKKRRSLLVFHDAVPAEIYRQLRVTLKITSLTE